MKILIDLPVETVKKLDRIAKANRRYRKQEIQRILEGVEEDEE